MLNMKYKDVLDIEWTLRSAELRAKTQWDDVVQYGKDDLLYELAYDKVKGLREAQKTLRKMLKLMKSANIEFEYSK